MEQPRLIRKLQVGLIDLTLTRRCKRAVSGLSPAGSSTEQVSSLSRETNDTAGSEALSLNR